MIIEELKNIVFKAKQKNLSNLYIRSLLKEYLQVYVLNYIYLNPIYSKQLIFTGGTCLRHCYDLVRLSEDLDFDMEKEIDVEKFKEDLEKYFKVEYLYKDVVISVLQRGKQVLLKFPVLYDLNIANQSESNFLYVKIDLSIIESKNYKIITALKSLYNFNYIVSYYDLPSLMASKIVTVLTRNRLIGRQNLEIIKGRDYFDLLWFLEKRINPNLARINDLLKQNYSIDEVLKLIDEKVEKAVTSQRQYFKQDLNAFINNPQILDKYIECYKQNYEINKQYLVSKD